MAEQRSFVARIEIVFDNPDEVMRGADVTYVDGMFDAETGKWFPQRTRQEALATGSEMSESLETFLDKARVEALRRIADLEQALSAMTEERDTALARVDALAREPEE